MQSDKIGMAKDVLKKVLSVKKFVSLAIVAAILVTAAVVVIPRLKQEEPTVDTSYMVMLLAKSSELTTAKLYYTGMTEFTDTGIAFINKSNFIMVYEAMARIGIDLEKVEVAADHSRKVILVTVPAVTVQEVKIDASSIKYFDQKFALFNPDEKEDGNQAIALAEEAALEEVQNMGVLQMAQDQSATLIMGILANAVPDGYTIEIQHKSA